MGLCGAEMAYGQDCWRMRTLLGLCAHVHGAMQRFQWTCRLPLSTRVRKTCRFAYTTRLTFDSTFEAPITTCFMMMVSMWYVRSEAPFRAGLFYCCNGVGSMIGGILSYGIGQINGFPVWKAVFLVCGGMTVIWGVVLLFLLPDSILSARFFDLEEKALLIARARLAKTGVLNKSIKWYQIREVFMDAQVWILIIFTLLNEVINGGVANFGKLIIKGLVGDPLRTVALGIPQGAFQGTIQILPSQLEEPHDCVSNTFQVFWILSGTFVASKFRNMRTIVMTLWVSGCTKSYTLMLSSG